MAKETLAWCVCAVCALCGAALWPGVSSEGLQQFCPPLTEPGSATAGSGSQQCVELQQGGGAGQACEVYTGTASPITASTDPQCIAQDQLPAAYCSSCTHLVLTEWMPEISYSLADIGDGEFIMTLTWTPAATSGGILLVISTRPWDTCSDLFANHTNFRCVRTLDAGTTEYEYKQHYRDLDINLDTLFITLMQNNTCPNSSHPSSIEVPVPYRCLDVHPGDCQRCGKPNKSQRGANNLQVETCLRIKEENQTMQAFVSWDYYLQPHPSLLFNLQLFRKTNDECDFYAVQHELNSSTVLQIPGRNVTLHNLDPVQPYCGFIRVYNGCRCDTESDPFVISITSGTTAEAPCLVSSTIPESTPTISVTQTSSISTTLTHSTTTTAQTSPPIVTSAVIPQYVVAILVVVGSVVLVVLITLLITILVVKYRRGLSSWSELMSNLTGSFYSQRTQGSVMLIYSQSTADEDKEKIEEFLIGRLSQYKSITVDYYDKAVSPDVPVWVEGGVKRCSKVLVVCNKAFKKEWEEDEQSNGAPGMSALQGAVVNCFKHIVMARLSNAQSFSSTVGLVVLRQSDYNFIPTDYLKRCNAFLLDPNKEEPLDDIARYVGHIPTFQPHTSHHISSV